MATESFLDSFSDPFLDDDNGVNEYARHPMVAGEHNRLLALRGNWPFNEYPMAVIEPLRMEATVTVPVKRKMRSNRIVQLDRMGIEVSDEGLVGGTT